MDRVQELRIGYLKNPLGYDCPKPTFNWTVSSQRAGAVQTQYQIVVQAAGQTIWDSGLVHSADTRWIPYNGPAIRPETRYSVEVRSWDGNAAYLAATAFWETGPESWVGEWISGQLAGGPRTSAPVPRLRTAFNVDQEFKSARLYVACLGVYGALVNGQSVGNWKLAPGWTHFGKRVRYQAIDISEALVQGENVLEFDLGDGWYCGHVEWRGRQLYGDRPKLLCQLSLDGDLLATSNGDWVHSYGPLLEADLIMGEAYDARQKFENWQPVRVCGAPEGLEIVSAEGPPTVVSETLEPVSITELPAWPKAKFIVDFGQNLVGHLQTQLTAPAGTTLTARFGEVLDSKGALYTANLRSAKQTDYYTFRGQGEETWETKFTFHGFRYVELAGLDKKPDMSSLRAKVVHSDTRRVGHFRCNDPLINRLVENIDWGWRGNSLDLPTDCPQRDERLGWTGDAQVFIRTATYLCEVDGFFAKYVQDLADAQEPSGSIPPTAPNTNAVGGDGGPAWSDAFIICPWQLYRAYGDLGILQRHYPAFKRFIDYLATTAENHIRVYEGFEGFRGFGDWLSIKAETPHELIGTAYYAYSVELMAKIAAALGERNDEARFDELHAAIRDAFIQKFVSADGAVATGSQTSQVLALHFNLVPEELRSAAVQKLVDDIESRDWHLSTGFVGSSYLPYVLSDNGRLDVAYKLLHQKTWPSWLYAVTQGATTIWERWDGWTEEAGFQDPGMNSFNHYAYGAIGEWLFTRVAGIELDDSTPGFQRFVLGPMPSETLDWIECEFNSPHGLIRSNWKREGSNLGWEVSVPPNTEATVHVPAGYAQLRLKDGEEPAPQVLGAGQYHFVATS